MSRVGKSLILMVRGTGPNQVNARGADDTGSLGPKRPRNSGAELRKANVRKVLKVGHTYTVAS
jgi:hypothetical protein